MDVIVAIDGGGSRTRCLVIDRLGRILGDGESGPSNHLLVAKDIVRRSLAEAIDRALAQGGLTRADVVCVSAGLAGVDYDGTGVEEASELLGELGFSNIIVNGDVVIAHYGALGGHPGVVALAGTGSVILGIGKNKERVKVGGWGPIYGDEGSAYRIAQKALIAAARAYDGRGPETALKEAIQRALGLRDFRETVTRIYVEGMEAREIAALSRIAYDVAESGDRVARRIFFQAGEELAEGVEVAIKRLGMAESGGLVSYQGSILESCALVRERFSETLRQRCPTVSIVPPRFPPVIGAYLIGGEAMGWTLNESVPSALDRIGKKR